MAGGEGSLGRRRRAAKSAEPAAPHATLGRCSSSTKRKTAGKEEGSSTNKKATKNPAPRATARKATEKEEAATAPAVATAAEAAPAPVKYRMTQSGIRYILNQKPMDPPPPSFAALRRSNPALTPQPGEEVDEDKRRLYVVAKAFFEMEEDIPRMQEWVRSELRTKGYVELDDEAAKQRAEADAIFDREWPAIQAQMNSFILEDKECRRGKEYHGGDESDSDEGEDSDDDESDDSVMRVK